MSYKVTRRGYIQLVGEPRGEADYGVECNAIECSAVGFAAEFRHCPGHGAALAFLLGRDISLHLLIPPPLPISFSPLSPVLPLSPSTFHTFWHFSYQSPSSNSPSSPIFHFPFSPSHISILLSSPHFFSSPRKRHQSPSISASIFSFSLPSI